MSARRPLFVLLLAAVALLAACAGAATSAAPDATPPTAGATESPPAGDAMAVCAPGVTDCVDMVVEDDASDCPPEGCGADAAGGTRPADGEPGVSTAPGGENVTREDAEVLIGLHESDLPGDVRVSRRGAEEFFLTEDYVIGRMTVELDDDGSGTFVVTKVVLEADEGPVIVEG